MKFTLCSSSSSEEGEIKRVKKIIEKPVKRKLKAGTKNLKACTSKKEISNEDLKIEKIEECDIIPKKLGLETMFEENKTMDSDFEKYLNNDDKKKIDYNFETECNKKEIIDADNKNESNHDKKNIFNVKDDTIKTTIFDNRKKFFNEKLDLSQNNNCLTEIFLNKNVNNEMINDFTSNQKNNKKMIDLYVNSSQDKSSLQKSYLNENAISCKTKIDIRKTENSNTNDINHNTNVFYDNNQKELKIFEIESSKNSFLKENIIFELDSNNSTNECKNLNKENLFIQQLLKQSREVLLNENEIKNGYKNIENESIGVDLNIKAPFVENKKFFIENNNTENDETMEYCNRIDNNKIQSNKKDTLEQLLSKINENLHNDEEFNTKKTNKLENKNYFGALKMDENCEKINLLNTSYINALYYKGVYIGENDIKTKNDFLHIDSGNKNYLNKQINKNEPFVYVKKFFDVFYNSYVKNFVENFLKEKNENKSQFYFSKKKNEVEFIFEDKNYKELVKPINYIHEYKTKELIDKIYKRHVINYPAAIINLKRQEKIYNGTFIVITDNILNKILEKNYYTFFEVYENIDKIYLFSESFKEFYNEKECCDIFNDFILGKQESYELTIIKTNNIYFLIYSTTTFKNEDKILRKYCDYNNNCNCEFFNEANKLNYIEKIDSIKTEEEINLLCQLDLRKGKYFLINNEIKPNADLNFKYTGIKFD
ncbi:hypothetical protein GVAV_000890 [Gurleya vavrai]